MRIPAEVIVVLVSGSFGLIPVMVQIASTRAQRRDRMTRLNHLRAERELLERPNTLRGQVSAGDEAAKPRTNLIIRNALSNLLDQYNKLSEIAPSAVVGAKRPSPRQLSFLRRAFLLYRPHTISGWILHTLFYIFAIIIASTFLTIVAAPLTFNIDPHHRLEYLPGWAFYAIPGGIVLLIIQRRAQRNAAQLDEPDS
jgi:hypothetical protein